MKPLIILPIRIPILLVLLSIGTTTAFTTEPLSATRKLAEPIQETIDRRVEQALQQGQMAGAVVVVADPNEILFAHAYGDRQIQPVREPMTLETLFDLASLTKPLATASSVMKLVEQGLVKLDAPVANYLPEFAANGKDEVTVKDLLLHQGGLTPDNHLDDYKNGADVAWQRICQLPLRYSAGEEFVYSDVGFIVLGKLVERVTGEPLDQFASKHLYQPLQMNETGFNPSPSLAARAAATERREGRWMRGEVHDPRAYRLGGVAGHAGLFSTAADLVVFGQMLLGGGKRGEARVLDEETVRRMSRRRTVSRGYRTLGWDSDSPYSKNRGTALSKEAFGHGGFTGTVFWVDPQQELVFIFLSNRLHPDGEGAVNVLAGELATLVGSS